MCYVVLSKFFINVWFFKECDPIQLFWICLLNGILKKQVFRKMWNINGSCTSINEIYSLPVGGLCDSSATSVPTRHKLSRIRALYSPEPCVFCLLKYCMKFSTWSSDYQETYNHFLLEIDFKDSLLYFLLKSFNQILKYCILNSHVFLFNNR